MIKNGIVLAVYLITIVAAFFGGRYTKSVTPKLISRYQLQEELVARGFDIGPKGVDGKIGACTNKAWDKATINNFSWNYR